jgi:dolichyl-phosphate-mannose--protein O-mannosyl transferase
MVKTVIKKSLDLSVMRTILSNQRTLLSYIKISLVILGIALTAKNKLLGFIALLIAIYNIYQYYNIATDLEKGVLEYPNKFMPLIFAVIVIPIIFYLFMLELE